MKAVLICPAERSVVQLLATEGSLATTPALGLGLVEYWMSHLACSGVKEVIVLAHDRPDEVRKTVGNGTRWGLAAEVRAESAELTPAQAANLYGAPARVMDHFPGLPEHPLFESYEGWFTALQAWMPRAITPERVGVREIRPGVWVGLHGHIAHDAQLHAPCWVGDHVYIGSGAIIGPGVVLEKGAFIEPYAELENTVIGPFTFVGQYFQITRSLVWGSNLVNWQTGVESHVAQAFLLCALHPHRSSAKNISLLSRVVDWVSRWNEEQSLESPSVLLNKSS